MYISELAERQIVVVYPGRFQPFHRGHAGVFEHLQGMFGRNNCFIVTSPNVKIDDRNPFDAGEKVQLMHAAGISNDRIKLITDPYNITVVTDTMGFNAGNTVLVFAVGAPDRDRLGVDQVYTAQTPTGRKSQLPPGKQVGDAKPMKTFPGIKNIADCVTVAEGHAYVIVVDEIKVPFEFDGQVHDISHGTECRAMWNRVRNDPRASAAFLTKLYGRATTELQHIFNQIPAPAQAATPPANSPTKAKLQKVKTPEPVDYTDYELSAESVEESTAKLRAKGLATRRDRFKSLRKEDVDEAQLIGFLPNPEVTPGQRFYYPNLGQIEIVSRIDKNTYRVWSLTDKTYRNITLDPRLLSTKPIKEGVIDEAAGVGVVASKKQAQDPRYSTSLTKDVRPGQINKSLRAFNLAETDAERELDARLKAAIDELERRYGQKLPQTAIDKLEQRYKQTSNQKIKHKSTGRD